MPRQDDDVIDTAYFIHLLMYMNVSAAIFVDSDINCCVGMQFLLTAWKSISFVGFYFMNNISIFVLRIKNALLLGCTDIMILLSLYQ